MFLELYGNITPVSRNKKKWENGSSTGKIQFTYRVEKEFLKPAYSASIGEELEDGLFDGNMYTYIFSGIWDCGGQVVIRNPCGIKSLSP